MISLTFLGTSNAFGHNGRHTSCYLIESSTKILLDAGYSLLSTIREHYNEFPKFDCILISHNHPDHFMGLPQLVLEDKYVIKRSYKIPVYGPFGLEAKIKQVSEIIYNQEVTEHIDNLFTFHEYGPDQIFSIPSGQVTTLPAQHSGNARMQIIEIEGKTIGYTGDTALELENFKKLLQCDIIITEASSFSHKIPDHITYEELESLNLSSDLRIYLSHLGDSVISNADKIKSPFYLAYDGLKIEI